MDLGMAALAAFVIVAGAVILFVWAPRIAAATQDTGAPLTTIDECAAWLRGVKGYKVRRYSTFEFGRQRDARNISVVVSKRRMERLLAEVRERLGPGLFAYIGTTKWYGNERHNGVELVVGNGTSQFDALRAARCEPVNCGLTTDDVIARLRGFDERFGVDVFQTETDTVQFRLKTLPENMRAFADEIYEFCEDIVDQGCGSIEALQAEIHERRAVTLWWD